MDISTVCRLVIVYSLISLLIGCDTDQSTTTQDGLDQIVVRLPEQPASFSPFHTTSTLGRQIYANMYNTLADYDYQTLELRPVLLAELPTKESLADGKTKYTMSLKKDAVWEDGSPVTAHDVIWTLKIMYHPEVVLPDLRAQYDDLVSLAIDPEDDRVFSIITKSKKFLEEEIILNTDVYPKAVYDSLGILDKYDLGTLKNLEDAGSDEDLARLGKDFESITYIKEKAGGSGPYKLENYQDGQFVVLKKKDDYWGLNYPDIDQLNQYPDRIIYQIVPDATTALTLLKNEEIDFMDFSDRGSVAYYDDLKEDSLMTGLFQFESAVIPRIVYILLNHEDPKLSDKSVRKAFRHMIDADRIINQLAGGYGKRQFGPVHFSKPQFNNNIQPDRYDPAKAKEILDGAGWLDSDGDGVRDKVVDGEKLDLEFTWHISGSSLSVSLSTMASEIGKDVGVKFNIIEKPTSATITENIYTGDYDVYASIKTQSVIKDDLYLYYHTASIGDGKDNLGRYSNQEVDELVETIRTTDDPAIQQDAYLKVQEVMYDDVDAIYLYSPVLKLVRASDVSPVLSSRRPGYYMNSQIK